MYSLVLSRFTHIHSSQSRIIFNHRSYLPRHRPFGIRSVLLNSAAARLRDLDGVQKINSLRCMTRKKIRHKKEKSLTASSRLVYTTMCVLICHSLLLFLYYDVIIKLSRLKVTRQKQPNRNLLEKCPKALV